MRLQLALLFVFGTISMVSAQYQVDGTVKDIENNAPIVGATVYLPDLKKGTVTDTEGNFTLSNMPRGRFLLEVKSVGYSPLVQTADIQDVLHLNLVLGSAITELNEVIISGVSHSTELKKNPVPVVTLNADVLLKNTSTNLIDNISQKPGVYQITTGAAVSKPVIRGLGYNRVITLYDGIRQEGQQWGDEHGVEIDEFSVDRVEIIKGAGSLMYGSDGIGGVINFLPANPVHEGSINGQWISNYQSNNGLFSNSLSNEGNIGGFYWSARASQKSASAYRNKYDGRVLNSGFREMDLNGLAGVNKSWGYTQFAASSFSQELGMVEGERDEAGNFLLIKNLDGVAEEVPASERELRSYNIFFPKQTIDHLRFSNATNIFFHDARLQLNAGYQKNLRREYGDVLNPDDEELLFDLRTGTYAVTLFLPQIKGWNFSIGTSGMAQQNRNLGEEVLIPEYELWDWGAVAFAKRNFNKLDVAGGVRFDRRNISISALYLDDEGNLTAEPQASVKFRSAELDYSNYSASVGLTYQLTKALSLKANISRGFRAPNIAELASNGRHEGSLRYEYGSYDLKAERSLQADLSFLVNTPHLSMEVSVFQNRINNFIYTKKLLARDGTDSIPDPDEPVPAYIYTQGTAMLRGGEVSIDLHPHPLDWLHFENGISIVYAENKSAVSDDSKFLPFTPAPRWQSELRASAAKWKGLANLFMKLQLQHFFAQDRVLLEANTETPTPSYSLWNTGCGVDLTRKARKRLSLYFSVNNVFDNAYQSHLSRLKYASENQATGRFGVFNMGRNFSLKIILPIECKKK